MHAFPCFGAADCDALFADLALGHADELAEVLVREAILLRSDQHVVWQHLRRVCASECTNFLFLCDQFGHLLDEPALDLGQLEQLVDRGAGA